ncbi:sodium- and chloride-dependent glycine transporter 2-like [Mizuhopecten yessoensis]|uniref:Transporter n=1 Tax=Mizuhopecten yessoensis TaxID=6573 RepID=A0A210PWB7_MIZYE|nr:sodium- and chloride-dependent glycine transporter 2-like [Mizuhopecten yessoensis]OWF40780.1 Sodium- and chloride-dependent glycine transporter 2 [Mizuhopecten yessoensis]
MDSGTAKHSVEIIPLQSASKNNDGQGCSSQREVTREVWARKTEYLLSLIGYSVGLGVLWRFPYLCMRNGGGAFLIPFFFFVVVCGFPLYYMELGLGQFSGKSPLVVWCICPLFKGLGFCMVIMSFIVTWYYNLVVAWVLCYLFYSFYPTQPWASCDNDWNSDNCVVIRSKSSNHNNLSLTNQNISYTSVINQTTFPNLTQLHTDGAVNSTLNTSQVFQTAATEFWRYGILGISSGIDQIGSPQWHLVLTIFLAAAITFLCLVRGVRSAGKVAYVTAILPYLLLLVLLARSLTLEGSLAGVMYFIKPDFSRLSNFQVWFEAALQVFFSLGPAWGGVITMASYNKFSNKCFNDAALIAFIDTFSNFFCGFVVFSILGFLAHESGMTIEEVAESGPGLVFQVYPEAISRLPLPNLWAVLFFVMLIAVGLDSQFAQLETVLGGLRDIYPGTLGNRKNLILLAVFCFFFLLSLVFATPAGMYIFVLVDWYATAYCFFLIAFFECLVVGWFYGAERFSRDIQIMTGRSVHPVIRVSWCIVSPISMLIALLGTTLAFKSPVHNGYEFPKYAQTLGVMIGLLSVIPLPILALHGLYSTSGSLSTRLKVLLKPNKEWGPNNKTGKLVYESYHNEGSVWTRVKTNLFGERH